MALGRRLRDTGPSTAQTSYSLKKLKDASVKGFLEQQSNKLGKKTNPLVMKEFFASQGITYNNDYNSWETALRETREETGLNLSNCKPKELYTSDDFGISNEDERLHTKTTHYLFHLGTLNEPPTVKAGSDIELLKWVSVTDFDLVNGKVKEDLPIRKSYLLQTLPRAIKKLRELELASVSNNMFVKYKSLGGYTFSDPFSLAACEYHQNILSKAIKISRLLKTQLDDSQLENNNLTVLQNKK
jgi:8-oxo-dGTP pyrophosphatase MutT (NUDIX family)